MLGGLATLPHRLRLGIKAFLHGFERVLFFRSA
jgi:hypothetical protein